MTFPNPLNVAYITYYFTQTTSIPCMLLSIKACSGV